jgi:hypothetical protein
LWCTGYYSDEVLFRLLIGLAAVTIYADFAVGQVLDRHTTIATSSTKRSTFARRITEFHLNVFLIKNQGFLAFKRSGVTSLDVVFAGSADFLDIVAFLFCAA